MMITKKAIYLHYYLSVGCIFFIGASIILHQAIEGDLQSVWSLLGVIMILFALQVGASVVKEKKNLTRKLRRIVREHAEQLVKSFDATLCNPKHDYAQVDASTFSHLDIHFYDDSANILMHQDFTMLRDVENLTMKNTTEGISAHSFLRLMLGELGTIVVTLYLLCPIDEKALDDTSNKAKGIVEFVTEFSDGIFVVTNNLASFHNIFTFPPEIHIESHPIETSLLQILGYHKDRIQKYCEENHGAQSCIFTTWEDVLLHMHRAQSCKATYRKAIGRISKDELRQLGTRVSQIIDHEKFVDAVYQEIQRINREDI